MIVKYAIANVSPVVLAHMAQDSKLDGSVYAGYGFGAWGVEPTAFIEFATSKDDSTVLDEFIGNVLFKFRENCAFRIIDGSHAALVFKNAIVKFEDA